jgi:hypothetical protein
MTAWLIALLIFSLTLRSKASGPLPAEKEVTILMGLSGYACAKAFIQINTLRKSAINFFMIEIGECAGKVEDIIAGQ